MSASGFSLGFLLASVFGPVHESKNRDGIVLLKTSAVFQSVQSVPELLLSVRTVMRQGLH